MFMSEQTNLARLLLERFRWFDQALLSLLHAQLDVELTSAQSLLFASLPIEGARQSDLAVFVQMAKVESPSSPADLGLHIVVPAFIISEFRTAFEIGCLLFIPFLLIDLVIASILLSAGMMMLPPVMISLPFKLMLFILIDGWGLLARSLSLGFR